LNYYHNVNWVETWLYAYHFTNNWLENVDPPDYSTMILQTSNLS